MTVGAMRSPLGRFVQKVDFGAPDDCWEWTAARMRKGYGIACVGRRNLGAHRVSWEFVNGPIPDGMCVLHRCDNPPCVNPAHLFLGTIAENNADMRRKGRHAIGRRHGGVKLTVAQVQQIRRLAATGATQRSLGNSFGVAQSVVGDILRGITWRHIPQPFIDGTLSLAKVAP